MGDQVQSLPEDRPYGPDTKIDQRRGESAGCGMFRGGAVVLIGKERLRCRRDRHGGERYRQGSGVGEVDRIRVRVQGDGYIENDLSGRELRSRPVLRGDGARHRSGKGRKRDLQDNEEGRIHHLFHAQW